jgi:hypothetical protein
MDACKTSNIETAALLPEGAEVKAFKGGLSRIEQARADHYQRLCEDLALIEARLRPCIFEDPWYSGGSPRGAIASGSPEAAVEILKARFKPDEVREMEQRST